MKLLQNSQVRPLVNKEDRFVRPLLPDRRLNEKRVGRIFLIFALVPVILLIAIIIVLLVRTWPILQKYSLWDLISGTIWKPQKGLFGFFPFISGTFWVTTVGIVLAVPACIFTAIYLAEYAHRSTRAFTKPLLDLLAAIPSVVYGFWGIVGIVPTIGSTIGPFFHRFFGFIPFLSSNNPTGYSILAGGIVLAVMITPFIISVTYEVLAIVPQGVREASLALGATRWQTLVRVVIPAAGSGISTAIILGMSRAIGETMTVLMVAGGAAVIPKTFFEPVRPMTAAIAAEMGEAPMGSLHFHALFSIALILFLITFIFNIIAEIISRRFRVKLGLSR